MNKLLHVEDAKYYNEYKNREGVYIRKKSFALDHFSGPWFIEDITADNDCLTMTSKITYVLYKPDSGTHRTCSEDEICSEQMAINDVGRAGLGLNGEPYNEYALDQEKIADYCRNDVIAMEEFIMYKPEKSKKKESGMDIKKIIFSGPCTIILWQDGTKTMARISEGEIFDPEKGVAICFMKKIIGHTETNKLLRKATKQYEEQYPADHILNKLMDYLAVKNHPLYKRPEEVDNENDT